MLIRSGVNNIRSWPGAAQWKARLALTLLLLALMALLSLAVSVSIGSTSIPVSISSRVIIREALQNLGWSIPADWPEAVRAIVWQVRVPRALLAFMVGASLATAGAAFQGLLRNPLADPYTLGVSSGATVGAAMVMVLGWRVQVAGSMPVPLAAMAGGLLTLWLVYRLAESGGRVQAETLILAGVVASAFMSAIFSFLVTIAGSSLHQVVSWMMGSLALTGWPQVWLLFPYFLLGSMLAWSQTAELNLISLGEESAAHLGVEVERSKRVLIVAGALLTGGAVSVSGSIAFLGLIVPHLVRMLAGPDHRVLVPVSALAGGIFLLWADTLARVVFSPLELPVGVITAALGGPFFAYLLRTKRKSMGW